MKKLISVILFLSILSCSSSSDDSSTLLDLEGSYSSVSGDDCGSSWQFDCDETLTISSSSMSYTDCGKTKTMEYTILTSNSNEIKGELEFGNDGINDDTYSFNRTTGLLKLFKMELDCLITETWQRK